MLKLNKEAAEKVIIVIAALILAGSFIYRRVGGKSEGIAKDPFSDFNHSMTSAASTETKLKKAMLMQVILKDSELERNPFKIPAELTSPQIASQVTSDISAEQQNSDMHLEGILYGGSQNLAIISGQVVSEGEYFNGYNVSRIEEKCVILSKNGEEIELKR